MKKKIVKAADILAFAELHNVDAFVVDDDDLYPFLCDVLIDVDDDTHKCRINASYDYVHFRGLTFDACL